MHIHVDPNNLLHEKKRGVYVSVPLPRPLENRAAHPSTDPLIMNTQRQKSEQEIKTFMVYPRYRKKWENQLIAKQMAALAANTPPPPPTRRVNERRSGEEYRVVRLDANTDSSFVCFDCVPSFLLACWGARRLNGGGWASLLIRLVKFTLPPLSFNEVGFLISPAIERKREGAAAVVKQEKKKRQTGKGIPKAIHHTKEKKKDKKRKNHRKKKKKDKLWHWCIALLTDCCFSLPFY